MQEDDDGNLHAVSYGACATTPAQANYSADDLEACALVYALKSIEELAIHKRITVITDNAHLLHLNTWHPVNPRQRRILTYLLQFNLSIRFIRGSRNLLADALSRLYQDSTKQEIKDHEAKYMHQIDDFILPVTTRLASRTSLKEIDSTPHPVDELTAPKLTTLTEQYETPERSDDQSTEKQTVDSQDSPIPSSIIAENADLGHLTKEVTDEPTDNDIVLR